MIVTLSEKGEDMLSIARRTAAGAAILLIMPLAVWISGWMWQPGKMPRGLNRCTGNGNGHATVGDYHPCTALRLVSVVPAFSSARGADAFAFSAAILVGQGVKSWVKDHVQEPRPFVVWLEKAHHVPVDEFYNLKRKDRGALVKEQLAEQQDIPKFLRKHWQKKPGSRFLPGIPCLLPAGRCLGLGYWPRRRTVTIAVLLVWATAVMGSRLLLGMHWPRDLVVATLISWVLVTLATWLAERALRAADATAGREEEIAEREQTGSEG
jgi:phosphatidylglycerophosphatase B